MEEVRKQWDLYIICTRNRRKMIVSIDSHLGIQCCCICFSKMVIIKWIIPPWHEFIVELIITYFRLKCFIIQSRFPLYPLWRLWRRMVVVWYWMCSLKGKNNISCQKNDINIWIFHCIVVLLCFKIDRCLF